MAWSVERNLLILMAAAYVVGSIPFGLLVGWTRGIDVRKAGRGYRGQQHRALLGKKYFFIVMILDLLKSLIPMLAASFLARGTPPTPRLYVLWLMVGFAAILGHMFSLFLKFKGGKGVATSTGVLLGLWPYYTLPGLVTIAVFIVLFFATRYISVGSLGSAVTFPLAYLAMAFFFGWDPLGGQLPLLIFAILISALVIIKHRSNIAGFGREPRTRWEKRNKPQGRYRPRMPVEMTHGPSPKSRSTPKMQNPNPNHVVTLKRWDLGFGISI